MIVDMGNFNVGEADELQDMQAEIYQQKQPNIQQEVFHTTYFANMFTFMFCVCYWTINV